MVHIKTLYFISFVLFIRVVEDILFELQQNKHFKQYIVSDTSSLTVKSDPRVLPGVD